MSTKLFFTYILVSLCCIRIHASHTAPPPHTSAPVPLLAQASLAQSNKVTLPPIVQAQRHASSMRVASGRQNPVALKLMRAPEQESMERNQSTQQTTLASLQQPVSGHQNTVAQQPKTLLSPAGHPIVTLADGRQIVLSASLLTSASKYMQYSHYFNVHVPPNEIKRRINDENDTFSPTLKSVVNRVVQEKEKVDKRNAELQQIPKNTILDRAKFVHSSTNSPSTACCEYWCCCPCCYLPAYFGYICCGYQSRDLWDQMGQRNYDKELYLEFAANFDD